MHRNLPPLPSNNQQIASEPLALLRINDVRARTGLARSTIYALVTQGRFPRPIQMLGSTHLSAWVSAEVDEWIREQVRAARAAGSNA
jgi:prophage regulatory protein